MQLIEFKTWRVRGWKAIQLRREQQDHEIDLYYFDSKFGGLKPRPKWVRRWQVQVILGKIFSVWSEGWVVLRSDTDQKKHRGPELWWSCNGALSHSLKRLLKT